MPEVVRHYCDVKKVLARCDLAQTFIPSKARFSPYRACEHACKYCDGRAERYYVQGDFEHDVVVRRNLPDLLGGELDKLREPTIISIGSGVSDPYQPSESDERLMARCARILADRRVPATVLTKSALPMRDIDTWSALNATSQFFLVVSLTTLDDGIRQRFEPHASPVGERLAMLRAFKGRGCRVGVLAMPLLPHITDTEANLRPLWKELGAIGVDFVMPGGLTLRPGVQKDTFMTTLQESAPDLVAAYRHIYREERPSGAPAMDYHRAIMHRLADAARESGIPTEVPHITYRNFLPVYDEIHVLMSHMASLYRARGIIPRRLESARDRYVHWYMGHRKVFNRHRNQEWTSLEELIRCACKEGKMVDILGNEKLASFISDVVLERRVFDYVEMRLRDQNDRPMVQEGPRAVLRGVLGGQNGGDPVVPYAP